MENTNDLRQTLGEYHRLRLELMLGSKSEEEFKNKYSRFEDVRQKLDKLLDTPLKEFPGTTLRDYQDLYDAKTQFKFGDLPLRQALSKWKDVIGPDRLEIYQDVFKL